VTVSERTCPIPDTVIYDVSALLWVIPWTTDKLSVYVNNFKMFVCQALQTANVTLVFDRYFPSSIKAFTRMHIGGSTRVHKLTQEMLAPAKQVVLTNTKNKVQLNAMLAEGLLDSDYYKLKRRTSGDNQWFDD